jgi:3-oxoacyl-[acyl-carrier protein] reductase
MTLTDYSNSLPEAEREKISAITPLRRLASAEDVAAACLFYASDLGRFVTSANIAPDGGLAFL